MAGVAPRRPHGHRRHWVAIDGMRAFAVVAVLGFHLDPTHRPGWNPLRPAGGYLGVDVFFVISGFLITSLLLGEWDRRGQISFRNFYARRALRLFPALGATLVIGLAILFSLPASTYTHLVRQPTLLGLPWVVFYVGNWDLALRSPTSLALFIHTWSLAVEEQFYLLFPVTFGFLLRRNRRRLALAIGLLGVSLAEMAFRGVLVTAARWPLNHVYYATDTHSDGLLLGAAVAVLVSVPSVAGVLRTRPARRVVGMATVGSCVLLGLLILRSNQLTPFGVAWATTLAVGATTIVVINVVTGPLRPIRWVLELGPVVWVGRRSYGLYLYSFVIDQLIAGNVKDLHPDQARLMALAASFLAAGLSYRFLERPFLDRRRPFQRTEALPATLEGAISERSLE